MTRDQKIKIAMVICATVLLCAVIITSTGMLNTTGIGGYANADQYTAGDAEITETVKKLDINWTSGKVILAYHAENTVLLQEDVKRELSPDDRMQWWMEGDTLHVQFTKPGVRWNLPEKILTVTLPEGTELDSARIHTTSGDMEIPAMKAKELTLESTSGSIDVSTEAFKTAVCTTSGDQKIRLTGETGGVAADSTSGSIALETGKIIDIEAATTSGGVSVTSEAAENVLAASTSGNIEVSLGGIRQLEINATSGSIRAALPENPGFTARVSTTSGGVTCAIPASKEGDRYVCGDGSAKVEITATSGNVRIEPVQTGNTEK